MDYFIKTNSVIDYTKSRCRCSNHGDKRSKHGNGPIGKMMISGGHPTLSLLLPANDGYKIAAMITEHQTDAGFGSKR